MGIIINDKNGETLQAHATITKAEQSQKLNAEDVIKLEIGTPEKIDFEIGSYIDYCGHRYTMNQLPSVTKNNAADFRYTATFEGEQYELLDVAWLLPTNTYGDSFTGNLKDFLDILIENVERSGKAWTLGSYPSSTDTDFKTLTYTQTNCLNVLQNLCKEWSLEFEIGRNGAERVLTLKEHVGETFAQRFEYGRTGGAYKIERNTPTNKNVITRLFCFGSDKNLPGDYRSNRLCLPNKSRNESYISDTESVNYYGIKEGIKTFDIYPARYAKVTAIDSGNRLIFHDSTMDFDLKETDGNGNTKWLIPGTVAKISFNSGGLAGYSFDIVDYNATTKMFKLKAYTDANGLQFPNPDSAAFQIKVGDDYFIHDIRMPQSYIDAAETKLQTEAQKYFEENCKPQVNYAVNLSPLFLKQLYGSTKLEAEIFNCGDSISVFDYDLGLSKNLRLAGFTRNLLKPYEFTLTIAENVEISTTTQRIITELANVSQTVEINDIAQADNARRNWLTTQELINSVFDPDGNYYTEKIKPLSIETTMLAVGARSQQFVLKNVNFEANYGGNANVVYNSAGTLEHYTIAEPDIRTWIINQNTSAALVPNQSYYIYAKCPRSGDTGLIVFDTEKRTVESNAQYYYFLVGSLTSVITDAGGTRPARNIALTYGSSTINGRFVSTGRIQSANGTCYIDLDNNEIGGQTFNFKSGLISSTVWVGNDKNSATAGLGGDYLIWAGPTSNNKTFYITKKGYIYIKDSLGYNMTLLSVNPDNANIRIGSLSFADAAMRARFGGSLEVASRTTLNATEIKENLSVAGIFTYKGENIFKHFQRLIPWFGEFSHNFIIECGGFEYMQYKGDDDQPLRVASRQPTLTRTAKGKYKVTFTTSLSGCYCFAQVTRCEKSGFYVATHIDYNSVLFTVADDSSPNDLTDASGQSARVQFVLIKLDNLFNLY
jgi:hypothetical protein